MKRHSLITRTRGKGCLFASLTVISSLAAISTAYAASVDIDYSLSGGAAFYTFSGTASATVNYAVSGISHSATLLGNASGATSWNISGNMLVSVDESGTISTSPYLTARRRAGVVNIDFPLLNLGGLINFSLDGTVASANSTMHQTFEEGHLLNDTDWMLVQDYALATGINTTLAGISVPHLEMPMFPQLLTLVNEASESSASLAVPFSTPMAADFLSQTINPGCIVEGLLGNCLASVGSIVFDFSGVYISTSFIAATGNSTTLLPTVVPVPASVWLFGSGIVGLCGFSGYARKKTEL